MACRSAQITPAGTAGVAVIWIAGTGAVEILQSIFMPHKRHISQSDEMSRFHFKPDHLYLGTIRDEDTSVIDEVLVVCDGTGESVEIQCHGGPRIIQRLMLLLQQKGIEPTNWEGLHVPISIREEVQAVLPRLKTRRAVRAVCAQYPGGLYHWARVNLDAMRTSDIGPGAMHQRVRDLLGSYEPAQRLIEPSVVVLVGAVNAGKSTLANALTGRQQSITSDRPGTTRDWTVQWCDIEGLPVELIDTAGRRKTGDPLEQRSIQAIETVLQQAFVVIVVRDGSAKQAVKRDESPAYVPKGIPVITVVNKCDLERFHPVENTISVSAAKGMHLDVLRQQIASALGMDAFQRSGPICFTERQKKILEHCLKINKREDLIEALTRLIEDAPELL